MKRDSDSSTPTAPGRGRDLTGRRLRRAGALMAVAASLLFFHPVESTANPRGASPWERVEAARETLDGATPRSEGVRLDLPMVTQDGSSVPLTVEVDSPMKPDDYIEALYLYASGNPSPELAEVHFTPIAGQARLSTRIRLDGSQTVVALARTSQGEWLAGSREVRVTVSGCISRNGGSDASDVMRTRVRPPNRLQSGEVGEVRALINHPMETGLREDGSGNRIPERIIREFRAEFDGEPVLTVKLHRAISANPFLHFPVAPGRSGSLTLNWVEDTGRSASAEAKVTVAASSTRVSRR